MKRNLIILAVAGAVVLIIGLWQNHNEYHEHQVQESMACSSGDNSACRAMFREDCQDGDKAACVQYERSIR